MIQHDQRQIPMATTATPPYEGGCLCGAVRYRVTAAPELVCHCHCTLCRRAAGAPVVTWATVAGEGFEIIRGTPASYSWSPRTKREFCGRCGSQLTFRFMGRSTVDFTVATLDRPEVLEPDCHVWNAAHLPWMRMDDGLPRHEGEFDPD